MLIATRVLKWRHAGGEVEVPIRIFAPESTGKAWGCRYEIDWPGRPKRMTAAGFDGVQALILALQMIGAELYTSSYHQAGELSFEKPGNGYGFPVASVLRDTLVGDDARLF